MSIKGYYPYVRDGILLVVEGYPVGGFMDYRIDGVVTENVPSEITKNELWELYEKNGRMNSTFSNRVHQQVTKILKKTVGVWGVKPHPSRYHP